MTINWFEACSKAEKLPGIDDIRKAPEWLVEITPIEHRDLPQLVIVNARSEIEAAYEAFLTRNMPNDWIVTAIDSGEL